jgi:phosphate transport system permease protein
MTDATLSGVGAYTVHRTDEARRRLARRYASERRFRALGLTAVGSAIVALVLLLSTVVGQGIAAFTLNYATLEVDLSADKLDPANVARTNFDAIVNAAVDRALPFATARADRRAARGLISDGAGLLLREQVLESPEMAGGTHTVALPVSDTVDLYLKGYGAETKTIRGEGTATPSGVSDEIAVTIDPAAMAALFGAPSDVQPGRITATSPSVLLRLNGGVVKATSITPSGIAGEVLVPLSSADTAVAGDWKALIIGSGEGERQISDREIAYAETLRDAGALKARPNWIFLTRGASREPEMAGVLGAVIGSFMTMAVTLALSFPLAVAAAVYLEEFAPKNRWTDLIEVNINNLAAVPSIVFGLLGLAVFLNFFGLPRSAPLVGGMVLALINLPTIIIASRAALKAVPPSIREAALGIGASRLQTVFHHVLPLALPGIMTGTIIGMAHALGETAPLLMIGMVAFIVDIPSGLTQPATVLPVQIFMWSDFPEAAFQQKTAAAIIILLVVLVLFNAVAVFLRSRFERRW